MFWVIVILLVYLGPIVVLFGVKRWTSLGPQLKGSHDLLRSSWILLCAEAILFVLTLVLGYQSLFVIGSHNIALHVVGGGVVTSVIFMYFLENLRIRLGLFDKVIILFFVACGLGVAVEMLEWGLDILSHTAYSSDRMDTWRDLGSDLLGAYAGFFTIECLRRIIRR